MSHVRIRVIPAVYLSENKGKSIAWDIKGQINVDFSIEEMNPYGVLYKLRFPDPSIISKEVIIHISMILFCLIGVRSN